jgi:hypothetical protein
MTTAKQTGTDTKKTRAPRKAKTAAELKAELEKAKAAVAALEQKAYAGELEEAVTATKIVAEFKSIQERYKDVTDVAILAAIGKAVGIKRLSVTQTEPKPRAPRKPK